MRTYKMDLDLDKTPRKMEKVYLENGQDGRMYLIVSVHDHGGSKLSTYDYPWSTLEIRGGSLYKSANASNLGLGYRITCMPDSWGLVPGVEYTAYIRMPDRVTGAVYSTERFLIEVLERAG